MGGSNSHLMRPEYSARPRWRSGDHPTSCPDALLGRGLHPIANQEMPGKVIGRRGSRFGSPEDTQAGVGPAVCRGHRFAPNCGEMGRVGNRTAMFLAGRRRAEPGALLSFRTRTRSQFAQRWYSTPEKVN